MENVANTGKIVAFSDLSLRAMRKRLKLRKNYVLRNRSPLKVRNKSLGHHMSVF